MSDFVLETTPAGVDVLTCADWQKSYSSKYDTLKCKNAGTTTYTTTANPDLHVIPHGLSYIPAFFCLVKGSGNFYFPLPFSNVFGDLTGIATISNYANSTYVEFLTHAPIGTSVTIRYFIFYNQLD